MLPSKIAATEMCSPDPQEAGQALWLRFLKDFTNVKLLLIAKQLRAAYRVGMRQMGQPNRGGIHVFDGGFFIVEDDLFFLNTWRASGLAAESRASVAAIGELIGPPAVSHFEIRLPAGWGVLRFGQMQTLENGAWSKQSATWFQIEARTALGQGQNANPVRIPRSRLEEIVASSREH